MGPQDVRHGIDFQELLDHLCAKGVSSASWAEGELVSFWVRITPDQVGHGPFVWNLAKAVDNLDLVDGVNRGRQAAVYAEYLVVDDHGQGKEIEHIREVMPHIRIAIFARALCVEAVGLRDAARLVVAADQVHAVRIAQLQTHEERNGLDRKEPAVDVVAW